MSREYDAPDVLLQTPGSVFRAMVEETTRHTTVGSGGGIGQHRTHSAKQLAAALRDRNLAAAVLPQHLPAAALETVGEGGGGGSDAH